MNLHQKNILELAKQGDTKAIEALINRSLQPKGITVKVNLENGLIQILVESSKSLDQNLITDFLVGGIKKLNVESIENIKIFSKLNGEDFPDWIQDISLKSRSEATKNQEIGAASSSSTFHKSLHPSSISNAKSNILNKIIGDKSAEDIWSKSRSFFFSAIKFSWKWYISGFKRKPDLPLFLSPRLHRILLTFFVFSLISTVVDEINKSFDNKAQSVSSVLSSQADPATTNQNPDILLETALSQGYEASVALQNSKSVNDLKKVISIWEDAISNLQKIPPSAHNYGTAKEKINQYEDNLKHVKNSYWDAWDKIVEPILLKIEQEYKYKCRFTQWGDEYVFTVPNLAWQDLSDDQRSLIKAYVSEGMDGKFIILGNVLSIDNMTLDKVISAKDFP